MRRPHNVVVVDKIYKVEGLMKRNYERVKQRVLGGGGKVSN